jgi:hypothetical protein
MDDHFIIINGKRYRMPKPRTLSNDDYERLYPLELNLLERMHNCASMISSISGYGREQRHSHSVPEVLFRLLSANDEGASIVASIAFLEGYGFKVEEGD